MDAERRAWLEKLDAAAQRALVEVRSLDDPLQRPLVEDLEALRERLGRELAAA